MVGWGFFLVDRWIGELMRDLIDKPTWEPMGGER